jgi:hypothetical protein
MPSTTGTARESIGKAEIDLARLASDQLKSGKTYRQSKREDVWRKSEVAYAGNHWTRTPTTGDRTADLTVVNLCFSTVNTIQPYITGEEPVFYVEPYGGGADSTNAIMLQAYLNRTWRSRETGGQLALRASVMNKLIHGDGFMKTSWELKDVYPESIDEPVQVAKIYVDRVSPWNIWIDQWSDGIDNARWVCERFYVTYDVLKKDDRYSVPAGITTGGSRMDEDDSDENKGENPGPSDWIAVYEFYDLEERRLISIIDESEVPLRVVDDVTCPIVQVPGHLIPNSPYHQGEIEQIWPLQQELNKTRSEMSTHRRRNAAKVFVKKEAIGVEGIKSLQSPIVGELVPVTGDGPLEGLVKVVDFQNISADNYNMTDVIRTDIFEITGVTEYQRGAAPDIRRTATEVNVMEGASNVKLRAQLASLETALRGVGELILGMAADIFPQTDADEMAMHLAGTEAERLNRSVMGSKMAEEQDPEILAQMSQDLPYMDEAIVTPSEEMFKGVYEVNVIHNSTEFRSPAAKSQKFREIFTVLSQNAEMLQMNGVKVNYGEVIKLWLEASDVLDVSAIISPAPPPPAPMDPAAAGGMDPLAQGPPQAPPPGLNPAASMPPELLSVLAGNAGPQGAPPMDQPSAANSGILPQL